MAIIYGTALADILDGSNLNDTIFGLDGDDIIRGGQGTDTLYGDQGNDTLYGDSGTDVLHGGDGNDQLFGGDGDDWLYGEAGTDTLNGGAGNDKYFIDSLDDTIVETANGGVDEIQTSVSYTLAAGLSIERLIAAPGAFAINLTGNELNNDIYGNIADNVLYGGAGDDMIEGAGGNDTIYGGDGNDRFLNGSMGDDTIYGGAGWDYLAGGPGHNVLVGGTGDDTYSLWWDEPGTSNTIVETSGEGFDSVQTYGSFALASGVSIERITALGSGVTLSGNELNNEISGNYGADVISGGNGNDTLHGKEGNDTLTGGDGSDLFVFGEAGAAVADQVVDFISGVDTIELLGGYFRALPAGALDVSAFTIGASANDADDRIVYDQATGKLYYDTDGTGIGVAEEIATLQVNTVLYASDFLIT